MCVGTLLDKWESIDSFNKHIFLFTTQRCGTRTFHFRSCCMFFFFFYSRSAVKAKQVIKRVISALYRGFVHTLRTNWIEIEVSVAHTHTHRMHKSTLLIFQNRQKQNSVPSYQKHRTNLWITYLFTCLLTLAHTHSYAHLFVHSPIQLNELKMHRKTKLDASFEF